MGKIKNLAAGIFVASSIFFSGKNAEAQYPVYDSRCPPRARANYECCPRFSETCPEYYRPGFRDRGRIAGGGAVAAIEVMIFPLRVLEGIANCVDRFHSRIYVQPRVYVQPRAYFQTEIRVCPQRIPSQNYIPKACAPALQMPGYLYPPEFNRERNFNQVPNPVPFMNPSPGLNPIPVPTPAPIPEPKIQEKTFPERKSILQNSDSIQPEPVPAPPRPENPDLPEPTLAPPVR